MHHDVIEAVGDGATTPLFPPPRSGVLNWDHVRSANPVLADQLAVGFHEGDPLADAAVVGLGHPGDLDVLIAAALDGSATVPRQLHELVEAAAAPPDWYDPDLVDAGGLAWWRFGTLQSLTLVQSLLYGYQSPGLSQPLVLTGRLVGKTMQRLSETGRWVVAATEPGGMAPGAPGWRATVKVRLIHALVRRWVLTQRDWDVAQWGVPINQTYMAETNNVGFFTLPITVAEDLGVCYSAAELEAMTHQWRWIGHVMGVKDELLPASHAWARAFHDTAMRIDLAPDDNGRALTAALLYDGVDFSGLLPPRLASMAKQVRGHILSSTSTRWVPRRTAELLGLRRTPAHYLVPALRPVVRLRESLRTLGLLGPERALAAHELQLIRNAMNRFSGVEDTMSANEAA